MSQHSVFHSLRSARRLTAAAGATAVVLSLAGVAPALATPTATPAAARAATPSLAVAPVGRLPLQGCTRSGTANACDLWAAPSKTTVLGSPLDVWGFGNVAPADATTPPSVSSPGPQLVVSQGDTVSITVHNSLPAGQALALAFPGIPAVDVSDGLSVAKTQTGIQPGATATYTFTASRAGTFLYEAGHTAGGSRQQAMGLVGALVVLPSDGATAYGSATSAYDDEAVMVLTEIDPVLNTDPTGFDMRNYRPAYRLINGNAFPETKGVATNQGRTVLLRLLNGGSQQHPMTLLGGTQTAVARDGHALTYPESELVAQLEPGMTEDTVVHMASGPESKVTLYESGIHLDNNAQVTDDPLQTAFGGMMTVLDTQLPPPSTDSVGPVTSKVAASPNPATGLQDVTISADLSDASTGGHTVDGAEFVVDTAVPANGVFDPSAVTTAPGWGTPMTLSTTGDSATGTLSLSDLAGLSAGKHVIYVRARDDQLNWGVVGSVVFDLPKTGPSTTGGKATPAESNKTKDIVLGATGDDTNSGGGTIDRSEFFVTDSATIPTVTNGSGTATSNNRVATVVAETGTITGTALSGLLEGPHHAWVHSHNSLGLWGPLLDIPFTVDTHGPTTDGGAMGPNPVNGLISDPANPGYAVVSAKVTDPNSNGVQGTIADTEAFLDAVGAYGSGVQMIPSDGVLDSSSESVYGLIPLSQLRTLPDGDHVVYIHGQDSAGNWGDALTYAFHFTVDKSAPVIGPSLTASPNPATNNAVVTLTTPITDTPTPVAIDGAEFWVGTTDPGVGLATPASVSLPSTTTASVSLPSGSLPTGTLQVNIRIKDKAGNWSNAVHTTVTVVAPALFSANFDTGTLSGWARVNTTTVVSPQLAANLPAPASGQYGLQIQYPTTAGGRSVGYIQKSAPSASLATALVTVDVKAAGLATGTATPTILQVTSPQGTTTFGVQLRTSGTAKQVRTTMTLSSGGTKSGTWVTLPAGATTLTLAWRAGPATGSKQGFLSLLIGTATTPASTVTGNTSTVRANGLQVGVVKDITTAVRGSAYFDNVSISR